MPMFEVVSVVSLGQNRGHYVHCTDRFLLSIESPWDHRYQTARLESHGLAGYNCFRPTGSASIEL